jgi:hypothetical protein
MPVLDILLHHFPERLYCGQIAQATFELENKASVGMEGLLVNCNHASFFLFQDPSKNEDKTIYGIQSLNLEKTSILGHDQKNISQKIKIENSISVSSVVSLQLPSHTTSDGSSSSSGFLGPNQTTLIPLWMKADRPGKYEVRILFVYQASVLKR